MSNMSMDGSDPTAGALVSSSGGSGGLVLFGGAITTAAALVGVYFAAAADVNLMGYYVDFILPIGALGVGLVASSGYGVASWATGTKISGRLLIAVCALLLGGYFLAQYLEFRLAFPQGALLDDGSPVGFWGYFDAITRTIAFEDHGKSGSPLGLLGYGVRALEAAGFVLGGVAVPAILRSKPYCESCQRYKRTTQLATFPASLPAKRLSKKKVEAIAARQAEELAVVKQAEETTQAIFTAAAAGDSATLLQRLAAAKTPRKVSFNRPPVWRTLALIHCPRCFDGELSSAQLVQRGRNVKRTPLGRQGLERGIVQQVASR